MHVYFITARWAAWYAAAQVIEESDLPPLDDQFWGAGTLPLKTVQAAANAEDGSASYYGRFDP